MAVTVKVDIEGDFDSARRLIIHATRKALDKVDAVLEYDGETSVEGAEAVVDRDALEEVFNV